MEEKQPGISFSALILASGLSERMGQPKAMLPFDGSRTFIEKIIGEFFSAGCEQVVCTVNKSVLPFCKTLPSVPGLHFVLNEHPEWGRLFSVKLGLEITKGSAFCFIQNIDNPFVNKNIILKLFEKRDRNSWCSPEFGEKGGHPVLLSKYIMEEILKEPGENFTLQDILCKFPRIRVGMEDDTILRNINTVEDYRRHFIKS